MCQQAMALAPARVAAIRLALVPHLAQGQTTTLDLVQAPATREVVDSLVDRLVLHLAQDQAQTTTLDQDQAMATRVAVDRLGQNQTGADVHRLVDRPMAQQQDQAQATTQALDQDQDMAARAAVTKHLKQVAVLQQLQQQQPVSAAVVTAPSTTGTRRRATMHRARCARSSMATRVDLRLARAMATRDMVRTQL